MGIGDWGLGIGAQSPIPNPQSHFTLKFKTIFRIKFILVFSNLIFKLNFN
jgi:hypothetical protein